jgi:hypothetical protein
LRPSSLQPASAPPNSAPSTSAPGGSGASSDQITSSGATTHGYASESLPEEGASASTASDPHGAAAASTSAPGEGGSINSGEVISGGPVAPEHAGKSLSEGGASAGAKVMGVAGALGMAGGVARDLYEGKYKQAVADTAVGAGLTYGLAEVPEAAPLIMAKAVIDADTPEVHKDALSFGERVDPWDHSIVGGLATAGAEVTESAYKGVFKPLGTDIGEGLAATYLAHTKTEEKKRPTTLSAEIQDLHAHGLGGTDEQARQLAIDRLSRRKLSEAIDKRTDEIRDESKSHAPLTYDQAWALAAKEVKENEKAAGAQVGKVFSDMF